MPTIDLKDLEKYVNNMAKQAMQKGNATRKTVIEAGKRHVESDVYSVYTPDPNNPNSYKRTGQLKEDWKVEDTADGIAVYNDRNENGKDIVDTIEYGRNYDYEFEYSNKPRPFIENTREDLRNGNELKEALKKDMKSMGLDVL